MRPALAVNSPIRATASIASGTTAPMAMTATAPPGAGALQPIGAGGQVGGERFVHLAPRLLERAGRKPEIDRAAVRPLHVIEAPAHHRVELVDEGGLEQREPRLADADERRRNRLVRAALGRKRDPRRRRDQHEARILVAGVVERIEPARDERIVERADRQKARAELPLGQAQCGEQQEKIVLGDAQFDVPPVRRERPALRRRQALLAEEIGVRGAREHRDLVDPAAEIGRDGHVGRGRDDARGEIAAACARSRS